MILFLAVNDETTNLLLTFFTTQITNNKPVQVWFKMQFDINDQQQQNTQKRVSANYALVLHTRRLLLNIILTLTLV